MWLHTVSFISAGNNTMSQTAMHPAERSEELSGERTFSGRFARASRQDDRAVYGIAGRE